MISSFPGSCQDAHVEGEAGEEARMDEFARWIKPIVPEVPVQFVPTRDDFWTV